jgi:hypothetical protein
VRTKEVRVSNDIEEFLRRAAARRQQRQGQVPQQPLHAQRAPEIQILSPAAEAEVVEAMPVEESVAQHVSQYLATDEFRQRAAQLGEEVGQADDQLKAHLSQTFEHKVGDLGASTTPVQMAPVESVGSDAPMVQRTAARRAGEIAAMFRSPKSLRQAIILSEIMRRPDEM